MCAKYIQWHLFIDKLYESIRVNYLKKEGDRYIFFKFRRRFIFTTCENSIFNLLWDEALSLYFTPGCPTSVIGNLVLTATWSGHRQRKWFSYHASLVRVLITHPTRLNKKKTSCRVNGHLLWWNERGSIAMDAASVASLSGELSRLNSTDTVAVPRVSDFPSPAS